LSFNSKLVVGAPASCFGPATLLSELGNRRQATPAKQVKQPKA